VLLTSRLALLLSVALSLAVQSVLASDTVECPIHRSVSPRTATASPSITPGALDFDKPVEQHVSTALVFCTPQPETAKKTDSPVKGSNQEQSSGYTAIVSAVATLLDSLAKILASIAWPIAAVIVAYYFKQEIALLLGRLKRFKAGNSEAEFGDLLREAEATADPAIQPDTPEEPVKPADAEEAVIHPRGSVISAWIKVENALFRLYKTYTTTTSAHRGARKNMRPSDVMMLRELVNFGALPLSLEQTFMTLRLMRAKAAHEEEFEASPEDVVGFINLAQQLVSTFEDAAKGRG